MKILFLLREYSKTAGLGLCRSTGRVSTARILQEEQASENTKKRIQLCVLEVIFINRHHIACHDVVI